MTLAERKLAVNHQKIEILRKHYKGRCFVCHKRLTKNITFHHRWYLKEQKTYKDFESSVEYNEYLLPLVDANPKQFLGVCSPHHQAIERLFRYNPLTLQRLIKAVKLTHRR